MNSPGCGAEADTSVIRKNGSPLGKTSGGGTVDAEAAVAKFMGTAAASRVKRHLLGPNPRVKRTPAKGLGGLLGGGFGGTGGAAGGATDAAGTKTPKGTVEAGVAAAAGSGATLGLPTVGADGVISMTMHQVSDPEDAAKSLQMYH